MPPAPRHVHPSIAPIAPGAQLSWWKSSPMFQFPDQTWNHGEGFVAGSNDADTGGWHGLDDGTQVVTADIHTTTGGWVSFLWDVASGQQRLNPNMPQTVRRYAGYLRPSNAPLPTTGHPFYGNIGIPYVDDAAFEVFAPAGSWNGVDPIVITIGHFQTMVFPGKHEISSIPPYPNIWPQYDYRTVYPGSFSPDGLIRREPANESAGFAGNTAAGVAEVGRPQSVEIIGSWTANQANLHYYPIAAYIVPPAIHRPVELVMQRNLQLVQAIKLMLQDVNMTPLGTTLTTQDMQSVVRVVFVGGSSGGFQAMMGALLYPQLVHGGFSTVFNASLERALGEQEMGLAIGHLSGFSAAGSSLELIDIRNWGQFAWNRGFQFYDISLLRRFQRGETVTPFCLYVGDEDITSTGTDWIVPLGGSPYLAAGTAGAAGRRFGWTAAEKADHDFREVADPFTGSQVIYGFENSLLKEVASQPAPTTTPLLQPLGRPAAESMRGIDDPQEWHFGRIAPATPSTTSPLMYDTTFFNTVQPGAAGTWLGHKESLLIANGHVYVGGTEGIVSRFDVDWTPGGRQALLRTAQSTQLGHEAWGLLELPNHDLVVGTRRHLQVLHPDLTPASAPVELLFEEAKPYRLHLAEADLGNPGQEIVFASGHGGLVVYSQSLVRRGEYAEPGVQDFVVSGAYNGSSVLTLLSERGVIANLAIDLSATQQGTLTAASLPQNGNPLDIEQAVLTFPGWFTTPGIAALYSGDNQHLSLRVFQPSTLQPWATIADIKINGASGGRSELATAHHTYANGDQGDHLLVLTNDSLILYDQGGIEVGQIHLGSVIGSPTSGRLPSYTMALHPTAIAVGELGDGSSGEYGEEIVVATETGHLVWLHIQDLLPAGAKSLPSNYWMYDYTSIGGSSMQPRTNQALSCAWGIADAPNDTQHLHMLDQDGNHWRVGHGGALELVNASAAVPTLGGQNRGWKYVGVASDSGLFTGRELFWDALLSLPGSGRLIGRCWCPKETKIVTLETNTLSCPYLLNNWATRDSFLPVFDGFGVFPRAGDVLTIGTNRDCFWWSDPPGVDTTQPVPLGVGPWANMVQGVHIAQSVANGVWSSAANPSLSGGRHTYFDLRNVETGVPSIDQESLRIVADPNTGAKYVILGCPGGRVRILAPGAYSPGTGTDHVLGSLLVSSDDYGHGGSALAVEPLANNSGVDIYFGVIVRHASQASPTQPLQDTEVMTGRVVKLRWLYGGTSISPQWVVDLQPSGSDPRGGYGVIGLYVDELFPNDPNAQEKEVVATTLAGDVFFLTESMGVQRFRTSIPGAAGFYNSIIARDLNGDGIKELYISGSMGLHRFVRLAEQGISP